MFLSLLLPLLFVSLFVVHLPFRWYVCSFFFPWLYHHPRVSGWLGITYQDDRYWHTNRGETRVHLGGLFIRFFFAWSGITSITLSNEIRKRLLREQADYANNIEMSSYFKTIEGKTLNVSEFEHWLGEAILKETNRTFSIFDLATEERMKNHLSVLRSMMEATTDKGVLRSVWALLTNLAPVFELGRILRALPEHHVFLLLSPQLTFMSFFSDMMVRHEGKLAHLQASDFLGTPFLFFVFETNGRLVFLTHNKDHSNYPTNRVFGPKGVQCPGNIFTFKFIKSILAPLQSMSITMEGTPIYKSLWVPYLSNKNDVKLSFGHLGEVAPEAETVAASNGENEPIIVREVEVS